MKYKKIIITFILSIFICPSIVSANIICNDGTMSKTCTSCTKGCCSGHKGCTNNPVIKKTSNKKSNKKSNKVSNKKSNKVSNKVSNKTSNTNILNNNVVKVLPKSKDALLKELTLNGEKINISDTIEYSTNKDEVVITAVANHKNATVKYETPFKVKEGLNTTKINVIAEDNVTKKDYTININRLSDNVGIKVYVNDIDVVFNDYISDIVRLDSYTDEIYIKYELEDEKSKVNLDYDKVLDTSEKQIKFEVVAESGKTQEYVINIKKDEPEEVIETNKKSLIVRVFEFILKILKLFRK